MRKHKTKVILAWGIISTIAALYLWNANLQQQITNSLLSESISLHKKAIANEVKSYQAINDCFVVKRGLCNVDEFKDTLQALGDEADTIYGEIAKIEIELK